MLNLNTVAAGGGSKLFVRNSLLVVGPEVWLPTTARKAGY